LNTRIGRGQKCRQRSKEAGAALIEEQYGVGEALGKAHVVSDDDASESELALEALDEVAEAAGDDGIDHGGGLVVEDHFRLCGQGAGDGDGAFAAGGQAGGESVDDVIRADQANEAVDQLLNLILGQAAALAEREGNVLADAEGIKERAVLEDHGDAAANGLHAVFAETGDLLALDANGAGIGLEKAHEHAQGDGFAHAAAAEDAEGLAALDEEADVFQDRPAIERDADMAKDNDRPGRLFGGWLGRFRGAHFGHGLGEVGIGLGIGLGFEHGGEPRLRDGSGAVYLGPEEIGGRVDVKEPARGGQDLWVGDLAGLNQRIDIQNG
jgi:hypothetical protein